MTKLCNLDKVGDEISKGATSQADLAKEDTAGNLSANLITQDGAETIQISDLSKIEFILNAIKYLGIKHFEKTGSSTSTKIIDGKELEMFDEEFFFRGEDGSSVTIHISTHEEDFREIKFAKIDFMGKNIIAGLEYKQILPNKTLELTHGDISISKLITLIGQTVYSSAPQK